MKIIIAALVLAAMSTQAIAYDLQHSMAEWERRRQISEMQRIDQAARYRQRQLEAENYKPGWR